MIDIDSHEEAGHDDTDVLNYSLIAPSKDIDEEAEAEMQKMADAYKMELDKVKEYLGDAGKESLKDDLAVQKAVDFIVDNAK